MSEENPKKRPLARLDGAEVQRAKATDEKLLRALDDVSFAGYTPNVGNDDSIRTLLADIDSERYQLRKNKYPGNLILDELLFASKEERMQITRKFRLHRKAR